MITSYGGFKKPHGLLQLQSPLTYKIYLLMSIIRIILSIILPPLGVFLTIGIKPAFWLNILLTILGFLPGVIHAVWIIAKND